MSSNIPPIKTNTSPLKNNKSNEKESEKPQRTINSFFLKSTTSSSSSTSQTKNDKYVNETFNNIFPMENTSDSVSTFSIIRKIKAILLFKRMQEAIGKNDDPNVDCALLRAELEKFSETKEISFSAPHNLFEALHIKKQSPQVQNSLNESIITWKKTPKKTNISDRPDFVSRTENKQEKQLTKELVQEKQDSKSISSKYTDKILVYDIITQKFIEVKFTAVDHADPWSLIAKRVEKFLSFVNNSNTPKYVKDVFFALVKENFSDFFIIDKETLYATEYLLYCLYNDTSNLINLNAPENTSKNDKDFVDWVRTKTMIIELLKNVTDSNLNLEKLLDRSGFIVKLKNDASIKENYRGKGLAEVLCLLGMGTKSDSDFEMAKEQIKNAEIFFAAQMKIIIMKNNSSTDPSEIEEAESIVDYFKDQLGKSSNNLRQAFKKSFLKLFSELTDDENFDSSSQELSDDDIRKELKRTKGELEVKSKETLLALENEKKAEEKAEAERKEKLLALEKAKKAEEEVAYLRAQVQKLEAENLKRKTTDTNQHNDSTDEHVEKKIK